MDAVYESNIHSFNSPFQIRNQEFSRGQAVQNCSQVQDLGCRKSSAFNLVFVLLSAAVADLGLWDCGFEVVVQNREWDAELWILLEDSYGEGDLDSQSLKDVSPVHHDQHQDT